MNKTKKKSFFFTPSGSIVIDGWEYEYPDFESVFQYFKDKFYDYRFKNKDRYLRSDYSDGQILI